MYGLFVGSPVFAYLSEKTDSILQDKEYPFSFRQLLKDMVRGIQIAIRNALWQTVYMVLHPHTFVNSGCRSCNAFDSTDG